VIIPKPSADFMLSTLNSPLSTLHFPDEPWCLFDEVRSVTIGRGPPTYNKPVISDYEAVAYRRDLRVIEMLNGVGILKRSLFIRLTT
jgi:hypothetical protein